MYVSGSMYPPTTYSRGEMEGDYPTVPPRLYPHECYPGNPLPLADGKPRPSFYISDILYPSVIPLPGTLPTTGSVTSSGSRLDETSPSSSLGGSPPDLSAESHGRRSPRSPEHRGRVRIVQPLPVRLPSVKSKDLKFGIDNILGSPSKPSERTTAEKETPSRNREIDTECEKRGFVPVPPSLGRTREPMIGSIHGDVPPHCILYPSNHAAYHHHHMGGLPPHSHAGGTRLAPTSTGLPSNLPGRFGPRPNEYPGVSSPGQSPSDRAPLPAHGSGCHQAPLDSHSTKRPRPLSVALCWPTVRFHHGPYSVLGSRGDNSTPQSQPKRKRSWSRAVFSNLQRKGLEKRFEVQKYVTKPDRRQVAAMLGLTDAQVKVWFQNRRMKWRHQEEAKRKKEEEDKKKKESELEKGKQTSDSPKVKSTEASKSDSPDTGSKADGPIESGSLGDIEDGEYSSDEERELKIDTQEEYESDMEDDDKCDQPTSMNTN